MRGQDKYERCVDQAFAEFRAYDEVVDIVAAWEQFLSDIGVTNAFDFQWFPDPITTDTGTEQTPTFTASLTPKYSIVADVVQEVPNDEQDFRERLAPFTGVETSDVAHNGTTPEIVDICLLITSEQAQTARVHLNSLSDAFLRDPHLVPLEFSLIDQDTTPKYKFERMSLVGENFRDGSLPDHSQMSARMSSDGDLASIQIPISDFDRHKATGVLCNKQPPNLYLACHMWDRVFYDQLNDSQRIEWQREDPDQTLTFEVEVDSLTDQLNEYYIPNGSVSPDWVDETLEYLCVVETAQKLTDARYRIDFRNLREKRREYKDVVVRGGEFSDLAMLFAGWHCENEVELNKDDLNDLTEPSEQVGDSDAADYTQPTIGEF
ncbi:hypothetical protein [Halomicrobium salinisoli]|uniref:hypothetical protein n=1 Tax=Halomicrobium salinisoli TaxID=2878391 RepID=UPI001CF0A2E8|nr:hypothetical protein [Halomicrobium salinisoli]